MKFKITIKTKSGTRDEEMDTKDLMDANMGSLRSKIKRVKIPNTQEAIDEYGKWLIEWFNSTCAKGESTREFISAHFCEKEKAVKDEKG